MKPMPKTRFETLASIEPDLIAQIRKRVAEHTSVAPIGKVDEVTGAIDDISQRIRQWAQAGWSANRYLYESRGWGPQEAYQSKVADGTLDRFLQNETMNYVVCFNHIQANEPTFFVNGDLAARLARTEMNVPNDFIRLPFKSCLFVFDDADTERSLYALNAADTTPPINAPISVFASDLDIEAERVIRITAMHGRDNRVRFCVKRDLRLLPGQDLEDALHTQWGGQSSGVSPTGDRIGDDRQFMEEGLTFIRTVLNVVLYISSATPEMSPTMAASDRYVPLGPERSAQRRREHEANFRSQTSSVRYIEIGASYRPFDASEDGDQIAGASRKSVVDRTHVRGHWKPQAHGPGWSLRKVIWVEPYWRGDDMADAIGRPYRIS